MTIGATRLTPGPAAEAWLSAAVAELKGSDPLGPLTVVVPNNYTGLALRRRLAADGYANVRHTILAGVAESLGAGALASEKRVPLTSVTEEAAIRAALREAGGIGPQTEHRAVVVTLRSLFRDLSGGELEQEERTLLAGGSELARVAIAAYEAYRRLLAAGGLYDSVDLLHSATEALAGGTGPALLADWGAFCVYLPTRLSAAELGLLKAIAERVELVAGLPALGDAIAEAEPRRWSAAFGVDWDSLPTNQAPPAAQPRLLIAPDAGEEVRAAVRMLLADLESEGVALHRTAIVYQSQEPYRQLVRETLDAAGLPWVGLGGSPVSESFVGRGLLGLLHLQGQEFSRASVINWLSSLPHNDDRPSLAQWDRVSREAGVVRGTRQWQDRLGLLAEKDRLKLAELEAAGDDSTLALRGHLRSELEAAEAMMARIVRLNRETRPPEVTSWPQLVEWARKLRKDSLRDNPRWPADQLEAARLVDETLESLAAAAQLDAEVTVDRFVETLEEALRARSRPEGKLGQGIVTGPISRVAGMSFDRLYILGMTERGYPAPPPIDPIFPWEAGVDPLGRVERQLSGERLSYRGAIASSTATTLCFPTHDTEQRPAYPARWLLDEVAELAGERIGPAALRELKTDRGTRPWLTSFVSTEAALKHAPVMLNLAERRVGEAREITLATADLGSSALAKRDDLPLGRALFAASERASPRFTHYDGNLADVAGGLKKLAGGLSQLHPISASGVETWASCPFHYFLGRVLEVEPTERPEDQESWTISPIDRGSLIHEILEEFFRTLHEAGRPAPSEAYSEADRDLLRTIAERRFRVVEDLGQTGYQLAWQNTQSAILLDLETVLSRDQEFRAENALRPEVFEQGFGFEAAGWPAAEVALSDGTIVRLRGYIDRVDIGDGAAYVTDYKTGRAYEEQEFKADPVVAGTRVQLAVYSNAVRRSLEAAGRDVRTVTASYWFISEKGRFERIAVTDGEESSRRLAAVMEIVNEGLTAGVFPQVPGEEGFVPGRPPFSNCRYCEYHRVCPMGRDQIRDRKKDEEGASLPARLVVT